MLLTCGTRSIIDACFDPVGTGELDQARTLARNLAAGMLLLADRNYAAADLLATLAATGTDLLIRCKNGRHGGHEEISCHSLYTGVGKVFIDVNVAVAAVRKVSVADLDGEAVPSMREALTL